MCDGHIHAIAPQTALLDYMGGEAQNMRAKILVVLKQRVDQPTRQGIFAFHGITGKDHLRRRFQPGNPWQPLGPPGAWQQPQLDLWQPHHCVRRGDTVITGKRDLQRTTHSGTCYRGDNGFFAGFNRYTQVW